MRVDLKGYEGAVGRFGEKPVQKAALRTLKRVTGSAVSTASSEIRQVYNVKKSDLDPRMKVQPPRFNNLVAVITIGGKGMSLSFFGAKQVTAGAIVTRSKGQLSSKAQFVGPTRGRRKALQTGVTVQVLKGKGATPLKSAFMAKMKSGHIGVMRRLGKKRLPINEKQVISLASMIQNANVQPAVLGKVQESWDKTFAQELNYQLNVKGKV